MCFQVSQDWFPQYALQWFGPLPKVNLKVRKKGAIFLLSHSWDIAVKMIDKQQNIGPET